MRLTFLVITIIFLSGCGEINIDCRDSALTKECKAIFKECNGSAWVVNPASTAPVHKPIIAKQCFQEKYEPKCGECKRTD